MKLLFLYWKLNLLSAVEYKVSFLMQVISMVINDCFLVAIWYLFYKKFGIIGGMQFEDFVVLMSIVATSFGFIHVFFGGYSKIPTLIEEGKLDADLLLPKNLLLRLLANGLMISAIGDIVFGIGILFFLPEINMGIILLVCLVSFFSTLAFVGFMLLFSSLAFYLGSTKKLTRAIFETILLPSNYPPGIFEHTIFKFIFMTIIPVYFIAFLPYYLIKDFNWGDFCILIGGSFFFLFLGVFTFYRGLKRYESGNMINTNV